MSEIPKQNKVLLKTVHLMVIWRRESSGHFMLWGDLKTRLQALTMGTASYSEFSNTIYTYTYLKNTPTSKKLVICLQSAVFGTAVQRHSAASLLQNSISIWLCCTAHHTVRKPGPNTGQKWQLSKHETWKVCSWSSKHIVYDQ